MDNKPKIAPHTWNGLEYDHKEKSVDWIWGIGLLATIGFIVTLFFHSYVFGTFILVSGATLIYFSLRTPEQISFTLGNESINIAGKDYLYKKIKGFHIKETGDENKILIMTDAKFLPVLTLPIPIEESKQAYDILIQFIPEIEIEESPSTLFINKIGF